MIAETPDPPYTVVVFTNRRTSVDDGYAEMADEMERLAAEQPGYLGIESVRDADGNGVTLSYWATDDVTRERFWPGKPTPEGGFPGPERKGSEG